MTEPLKFQIRIYLADEFADIARRDPEAAALKPLTDILKRHNAAIKSQFDAFAGYVAEAEAQGTEDYPLYRWTKATIEDPAKQAKYKRSFTVYAGGDEVYDKEKADALEADLKPLAGGDMVAKMTRHDTNPANNPQPPEKYRK